MGDITYNCITCNINKGNITYTFFIYLLQIKSFLIKSSYSKVFVSIVAVSFCWNKSKYYVKILVFVRFNENEFYYRHDWSTYTQTWAQSCNLFNNLNFLVNKLVFNSESIYGLVYFYWITPRVYNQLRFITCK